MSTMTTIIGSLAASLTTISFVPQAWRIIKTGDTKAISLWSYSLFALGIFLWMVYGFLLMEMPIIIANIVTFILVMIILVMKIRLG